MKFILTFIFTFFLSCVSSASVNDTSHIRFYIPSSKEVYKSHEIFFEDSSLAYEVKAEAKVEVDILYSDSTHLADSILLKVNTLGGHFKITHQEMVYLNDGSATVYYVDDNDVGCIIVASDGDILFVRKSKEVMIVHNCIKQ